MSTRYEFQAAVSNSSGKQRVKKKFRGVLLPKGEETVWLTFDTRYCGTVSVSIDSIKVYDFLGIFYRRVKWKRTAQVKVMPVFELMPLEITRRTRISGGRPGVFAGEARG